MSNELPEEGTAVVINTCWGGFGLSQEALNHLKENYEGYDDLKYYGHSRDLERDDPNLVETVLELGKDSFGDHAELAIAIIPDDVDWIITEHDGWETVEEKHRSWG